MHWLLIVGLAASPAPLAGQPCSDTSYRWTEKTDTSFATASVVTPASITAILATWAPLAYTGRDRCAPRSGRERQVYTVIGWVRRIQLHEDDGDWQIELTGGRATPVDSCIVVDIPAVKYGATFQKARSQLTTLIDTTTLSAAGNLRTPLALRFAGLAFFDGIYQKRSRAGARSSHAEGHAQCNSSPRALWELHPVYQVTRP